MTLCRDHLPQGEPFSETKKRLQARTGTSDKDLAKMKFAIVQPAVYKQPAPIQDDDVLADHKWADEDLLGMDHVDKRRVVGERGVFIRASLEGTSLFSLSAR